MINRGHIQRWMTPGRPARRGLIIVTAACILSVLAGASTAFAHHLSQHGWVDEHKRYPTQPNGLTALNSTFGQKCSSAAYANANVGWIAYDDKGKLVTYKPKYHKKLGGASTSGIYGKPKYPNAGSTVMEDVATHLNDDHRTWPDVTPTSGVKGGVFGYLCRKIKNSTKYSTHSWGVAIDINAMYERYPDPDCEPNSFGSAVSSKWTSHGFYWGANFGSGSCDPMHFQYVRGY